MFRLFVAAIAAAILLSFAPSTHAQEPPLLGDVRCDGDVTSIDALFILWLDAGLIEALPCADGGDVNNDGVFDPIDAALVLQFVDGLIGELPPTPPEPLPPPASGGVAIDSAEGAPGQRSTVVVVARGIAAPGLGAWTIDVQYNPSVVSLVDCYAEQACNEIASGVLRLSGASAGGLEGDTELGGLILQCEDVEGVSDLTLNPRIFADATLGGPQPFVPTVTNGSITCAEAPLPTPRPGAGRLNITLIHDLDADGVFDPGEPGLEGWSVDVAPGCSDILLSLQATDEAGRTSGEVFGQRVCVIVRQVGWVLTSGSRVVDVEPGTTVEAIFLFRKVGQEYFRLTGDLIVNGLPAIEGVALDAVVGERSCGDAQIRFGTVRTSYSLYVLSKADRSGCANEGQEFTVTIDGKTVHQASFTSNPRINSDLIDLVLGPTPMWFFGSGRDGIAPVPFVGPVMCGEAREIIGSVVPDYYEIYVFPNALRSGCGAPGRIVTLRVGDEVLRSVVWQAGFVPSNELQDVELPVVGTSGAGNDRGGGQSIAIALAIAGLFSLSVGAVFWRGRRPG